MRVEWIHNFNYLQNDKILGLARVAQLWARQTHDLVVKSLIPGWGELSSRRTFPSHICRREK